MSYEAIVQETAALSRLDQLKLLVYLANLIKENKIYLIYCELQVKYLMEKILKLEKFSFYLDENGENGKQNR